MPEQERELLEQFLRWLRLSESNGGAGYVLTKWDVQAQRLKEQFVRNTAIIDEYILAKQQEEEEAQYD